MALKSNKQVVRRWKESSPPFVERVDEWLALRNWKCLGPGADFAAYEWVLSKPAELQHVISVRLGASSDPQVRVTTTAAIASRFVTKAFLQSGFYDIIGHKIGSIETSVGAQVVLAHGNDLVESGSLDEQYIENLNIDPNEVSASITQWTKTFEVIDRLLFAETQSVEQVARWIERFVSERGKNPMSQISADAIDAAVLYAQANRFEDSLRMLEFSRIERVKKFREAGFLDWIDRINKAMDSLQVWIASKK
jgi:hypothetical protein